MQTYLCVFDNDMKANLIDSSFSSYNFGFLENAKGKMIFCWNSYEVLVG